MLKRVIKIAAALMIIVFCTVCLDHIFIPKYINENTDGRITEEFYTQASDPDVIFLGASCVHYCVSPDYMWQTGGFTSYDRSNASQTMWQSYYLLRDALAFGTPSLVVLDISFIKNGEEFVEEPSNRKAIELMRDPVAKLGAVMSSVGDFEEPVSYFLPILRYHSRWKELTVEDVKYAFERPPVTYDGYLMDFSVPDEQNVYEPESIDEVSFPPKATEYLEKLMALCREKGIPLFLMKTPTFVNSWHREYDDALSYIAERNGLVYKNFTPDAGDMGIEVRYDYIDDGEHMNINGAHKFSQALSEYLRENYELPDHGKDEELLRIWDAKVKRYQQAVDLGMGEYEKNRERIRRKESD